jgi:GT2 family glycosyltransferase
MVGLNFGELPVYMKTKIKELGISNYFGVVVPTLGQRLDLLRESLGSIRQIRGAYIFIVSPDGEFGRRMVDEGLADKWIGDPGLGVAAAINLGFMELPKDLEFVAWLGDDDQLVAEGTLNSLEKLSANNDLVATFGVCEYLSESGELFWVNTYGQSAVSKLRFGPDRIPQPGSIFRRYALEKVGFLDTTLKFAFDLDLFIKLSKIGRVQFVSEVVSRYRWHPGSLSSSGRRASNSEARRVRQAHLPKLARLISWTWEMPMWLASVCLPNRFDTLAAKSKS